MSLDLSSTILDLIKSVNDVTETFVSRNGSSMYGSLSPYNNKGASLGTSSKQWNTIYGGTIYENGTSLSNKYGVTVTQKLTSGEEIGSIKVGSTTTKLYAPTSTGSGSYQPKKRKVTLAELRAAMPTMTTGTRIQVVPRGIDEPLLYSIGACIAYSEMHSWFYNAQTDSNHNTDGYIHCDAYELEIDDSIAVYRYLGYDTNGSSLVINGGWTENLTDDNTDFYILD